MKENNEKILEEHNKWVNEELIKGRTISIKEGRINIIKLAKEQCEGEIKELKKQKDMNIYIGDKATKIIKELQQENTKVKEEIKKLRTFGASKKDKEWMMATLGLREQNDALKKEIKKLKEEKENFIECVNKDDIRQLDSQGKLEKAFIGQIVKRDKKIDELKKLINCVKDHPEIKPINCCYQADTITLEAYLADLEKNKGIKKKK